MKRTALKRRTWLRQYNPERRRRLYDRNYGMRGHAVRSMQCLVLTAILACQEENPDGTFLMAVKMGSCEGKIQAAGLRLRDEADRIAKMLDEAGLA